MQSGRAQLLRAILINHFRRHQPLALSRVEDLVSRVVGGPATEVDGAGAQVTGVLWTEAELCAKLEERYGVKIDLDPQAFGLAEA